MGDEETHAKTGCSELVPDNLCVEGSIVLEESGKNYIVFYGEPTTGCGLSLLGEIYRCSCGVFEDGAPSLEFYGYMALGGFDKLSQLNIADIIYVNNLTKEVLVVHTNQFFHNRLIRECGVNVYTYYVVIDELGEFIEAYSVARGF